MSYPALADNLHQAIVDIMAYDQGQDMLSWQFDTSQSSLVFTHKKNLQSAHEQLAFEAAIDACGLQEHVRAFFKTCPYMRPLTHPQNKSPKRFLQVLKERRKDPGTNRLHITLSLPTPTTTPIVQYKTTFITLAADAPSLKTALRALCKPTNPLVLWRATYLDKTTCDFFAGDDLPSATWMERFRKDSHSFLQDTSIPQNILNTPSISRVTPPLA